jgi:ADP-heptose:LPS heptosyltransferase
VIRCLKKQLPSVEIHYLTKKQFASILTANPYITKVHQLSESLDETIAELKAEKFDLVIDLHKNLRTLKVKSALGVSSHSFSKLNIEKWLMTTFKWNILPDIHIVDRYMQTTANTGIINDGQGLDYFIPESEKIDTTSLPFFLHRGYFAAVIGAAHATKKLPVEKWKEVCRHLTGPVIILGGKDDFEAGEIIAASDSSRIYNACGKYSLHQSASLVSNSKVVISHDTGLMHIAAALKKPLVSIWGNTIPGFGMYAYYGDHKTTFVNIEVEGLSCRPCSKIGYTECPKKHFKCMKNQSGQMIAEKANSFFSANI